MRHFAIPIALIQQTIAFLRSVGEDGLEGFALWSGRRLEAEQFLFSSCIIPEQNAMVTSSGLLVTVEGLTLFNVNKLVHERGETLAAQVHSHPTEAYHSDTDDTYPLVTILGGLSIVIPDFARNAPEDLDRWAWYRLSKRAKWEPASKSTTVEIE